MELSEVITKLRLLGLEARDFVPNEGAEDAVQRSYRRLALQFHPDRNHNKEGAAERFRDIEEARTTLLGVIHEQKEQGDLLGAGLAAQERDQDSAMALIHARKKALEHARWVNDMKRQRAMEAQQAHRIKAIRGVEIARQRALSRANGLAVDTAARAELARARRVAEADCRAQRAVESKRLAAANQHREYRQKVARQRRAVLCAMGIQERKAWPTRSRRSLILERNRRSNATPKSTEMGLIEGNASASERKKRLQRRAFWKAAWHRSGSREAAL